MKDREKQIKEMAKIIKDNSIIDVTYGGKPYADDYENLARKLLEHYQPKLPEDSVVLTKQEYLNTATKIRAEFEYVYKDKVVLSKEEYKSLTYWKGKFDELIKQVMEQSSKETADKFLIKVKQLVEKWLSKDDEKVGLIFDFEEFIREQFGVYKKD